MEKRKLFTETQNLDTKELININYKQKNKIS